jgi:hypothetical protein
VVYDDLSRQGFGVRGNSTLLRFESRQQLDCLTAMLGTCIKVGLRKKQPGIGEKNRVEDGDILNIVGAYNDAATIWELPTKCDGIDLICTIDRLRNHHLRLVQYDMEV